MSDHEMSGGRPQKANAPQAQSPASGEPPSRGPSLTLLYSILAFALVAAIALALLIVLPFWRRH